MSTTGAEATSGSEQCRSTVTCPPASGWPLSVLPLPPHLPSFSVSEQRGSALLHLDLRLHVCLSIG
jgi:hypothetical protein